MYRLKTLGSVSTDVQVAVMSLPLVMTSEEAGEVKSMPRTREGRTVAKAAKYRVWNAGILEGRIKIDLASQGSYYYTLGISDDNNKKTRCCLLR